MFELKQFLFKTHTLSTTLSAFLQTLNSSSQTETSPTSKNNQRLAPGLVGRLFLFSEEDEMPGASCTAGTVSSRTCLDGKEQRDKGGDLGDSFTSPQSFLFYICFPTNSLRSLFFLPRPGQTELPFPCTGAGTQGPECTRKCFATESSPLLLNRLLILVRIVLADVEDGAVSQRCQQV